jgi:L-lactate dehydrogenase complex protein LldF
LSADAFRRRIRAAIADPQLQTALDANAERRVQGRQVAFASLPDWRARRQTAHAIRADVIERLDDYLHSFTERAEENGMVIHRAADAQEAVNLVMDISQRSLGSEPETELLFAKSKSMVSEEIQLNHTLEERGHRVVETDLGEFIVQLRHERPAHIITPAVHLQRRQVGKLFEEQLGLPYTEDIAALTAAARRVLREVFLKADVGISGVNFGVAETGAIVIVTNEGNGRMVTTMPRVHIALMGIERLVPTMADLAVMLALLPRSATGQKLSVYTQLIRSPRQSGERDGALERHIIVVDNGRMRMRDSGMREALYCIRCGACLNACPVFREIGGHAYVGRKGEAAPYPGPIGSIVSPSLLGPAEFGQLAQASSLCGACKDACPVDIDLPRLLTRVRAGEAPLSHGRTGISLSTASRRGLKAYALLAASPNLFAAAQKAAAAAAFVMSPRRDWLRMPAWTGWGLSKDMPKPATKPFRERWKDLERAAAQEVTERRPVGASGDRRTTSGATPDQKTLVDRFEIEATNLGARVERIRRRHLGAWLVELLRRESSGKVMVWAPAVDTATVELEKAGWQTTIEPDAEAKTGITTCTCAIAETGTLVLTEGPGQPLSTSLLPETHIAILEATCIVPTLEEALGMPEVLKATNCVLISGPSRTADIEMTLTIGVHGPRELLICIVV